jgi:anti-anti-sigma regulatory factor
MLAIQVEKINELSVVACKGRIVNSDAVLKLRDVVLAQATAHFIALDLSEVMAIGGGGLGMLAFLQHWADQKDIQLKLFSPSSAVMDELERTRPILNFEIATFHEMVDILSHSDDRYDLAA